MATTSELTVQTILDALRPSNSAENWHQTFQDRAINWNDLAIRAIVLGLAPQLYHRLAAWEIEIPARAFAKLKVTHSAQTKRAANIYQQLNSVLEAAPSYGLEPIVLKGAHLAAHVYADPALRPMNDIDLLFRPKKLADAERMLRDLGYGGKHKSAETGAGVTKHTSTFKRDSGTDNTPNPYLSAGNDRMIEPHRSLEESWYGLKVDITPQVRERAELAQFGAHQARVLCRTDLLLHVCVHFCFHLIEGAPSLVQFTDSLTVAQAGGVDWDDFVVRAVERQAAPFALAALTLSKKLLDAPVSAETLTQLREATPPRLQEHIAQLGLRDILKRSQQKPVQTLSDRIQRGYQDRAATALWASDLNSRWQVWRTLVDVTKTDTGRMLLGQKAKQEI
ncbi:MAG: nucleotidyltransferase domain-containing protein [Candidatus Promineifilaceae bacterium]